VIHDFSEVMVSSFHAESRSAARLVKSLQIPQFAIEVRRSHQERRHAVSLERSAEVVVAAWTLSKRQLGCTLSLCIAADVSAQQLEGWVPTSTQTHLPPLTVVQEKTTTVATERSEGSTLNAVKAGPSLIYTQSSGQTGMSSKPPEFTIPPTSAPTTAPKAEEKKDDKAASEKNDAAGSDKAANEEKQSFAGHGAVQDAFDRLATGTYKNTKYKWYGFVRMDAIYDVKPIRSTDMFVTSAIPIPQGEGQNMVLTPRYTRLGFDTETKRDCPDWTIKTRIEMDFFNGNTSGLFGSFPIRLRFAWIEFDHIRVGQDASVFMDYDVFPNVLDYEGPPGMVLMRQPIFSLRFKPDDHWRVAVGVEQPYSDIEWFENGEWIVNPGTGIITDATVSKNIQDLVDFTGHVRYEYDYGHMQAAGILRKLSFQPVGANNLDELGYGVNLSGTFHPWAYANNTPKNTDAPCDVWHKSRILAQYAGGRGINRYIQDVNGLGLDATFDPLNGFRTIPCEGWFVSYEHWLTKKWIAVFTYGQTDSDLTDTLPDNTYQSAAYAAATLIWLPVERMGVGWEFLYGRRENKNGEDGEAYRLQAGIQYRF
jgi:hypothetical protein